MPEEKQGPWPNVKRERVGDVVVPDGYERTDRNLTGPLRMGTEPRVGPRGLVAGGTASDFEMDRISPRDDFDPMGTVRNRTGDIRTALLSREIRSRPKEDRSK